MVLSSGQLLESIKRSPPQELKLSTVQALDIDKKKINLPTITIIDSSPVHELSPQQNFATKLAPTAVQSNTTRALSESPPLLVTAHNLQPEQSKDAPTIEALIRATKATFKREEFDKIQQKQHHQDIMVDEQRELCYHSTDVANTDNTENSTGDGKPKPSDLPPLKTLTLTCPSSPLLQRHALLQAQKGSETLDVSGTSPPILRPNRAKRSPPLFRTSLTEIDKGRGPYGSAGSLSPSLTRRFSGQGGSLLTKSLSFDRKDGSVSPAFSDNLSECADMEIDIKSDSSQNSELDMTVRSGLLDSLNVRKKNVTFSLELDEPSSEKKESNIIKESEELGAKIKDSGNKESVQSKSPSKEGKKKGPLGIVMGKAAIAARAVSSSAHRSIHTSTSSKQPVVATKSAPTKSDSRKHSHGQCVMGTNVAQSSRVGHVSCATCGRRRAASQSNMTSEPPVKQQAKGKQAPVRKVSVESFPKKTTDSGRKSPREESQKGSKGASAKKDRKPFFV